MFSYLSFCWRFFSTKIQLMDQFIMKGLYKNHLAWLTNTLGNYILGGICGSLLGNIQEFAPFAGHCDLSLVFWK